MTTHSTTTNNDGDDAYGCDDDAAQARRAFARLGLCVNRIDAHTREDVRKAFRAHVIRAHPDRNDGDCAPYEQLCAARDRAYEIIDRRDILACAARYDWRASRTVGERRGARRESSSARKETTRATSTRKDVDESTSAPRVRASLQHKTRVTAMCTLGLTMIATGERSGRVTLWSTESGKEIDSFHAPAEDDGDAVSIIEYGARGRLAATYVKTKPHFVSIHNGLMSKPIVTAADCHVRRVTSATWFARRDADNDPISDVFVTGALDGSVALQSFKLGHAHRLPWTKSHAVIALATVRSTASSGYLIVSDTRGNFQIFRVHLDDDHDRINANAFSNVVTWNGFGGISRVDMTLSNDDARLKIITVFNDAERHQSRVLEWSTPIRDEDDVCVDILGFDSAIPSAKSTFHGLITDFKRITMKNDDEEDEDVYVVVVKDGIYAVDATSKSTLYALDVDVSGSFIYHDASKSNEFTVVSLVGDEVVTRTYACDDGAPLRRAAVTARDVFFDDEDEDIDDTNHDATTKTTRTTMDSHDVLRLLTTPRHVVRSCSTPCIVVAALSTVLALDASCT